MGSHIGCQETTAEAANNKQATGSASGDNKEDITGLQIQQKAGFPKFGQDEYYNCIQFHFFCDSNWTSDLFPAGLSASPSLLSPLLPLSPAASGHPKKATKPRGWGGRGLEEPGVESKILSFMYLIAGTLMALW